MTTQSQDKSSEAEEQAHEQQSESIDRSVWLIWGGIMLVACAVLPFVARGQDLFRSVAALCGFDLGSLSS